MPEFQWRILLVEDDEDDYILTRDMLNSARGSRFALDWASTYHSGLQMILGNRYDAILMDYELGPRSGIDLTREIYKHGCRSPIILLTGQGNYEIDMEAMQVGITDYLSKDEATASLLERTIRYAILQKQTEEDLRRAKEELETRVQERTVELTRKNQALEAEVSERMRIEAELAEVQGRLMDRNEAERLDLAREIHDGPMQELYGLVFEFGPSTSEEGTENGQPGTLRDRLLQVIQGLRTISRDLRPPALAPYGLEKAIRSHATTLKSAQPGLNIQLDLDSDGRILPEAVRLALFRIYQVAITNVIRHARATEAHIVFRIDDKQVQLEVRDNGCGFSVPRRWVELARLGHLGLVGAVERAEAIGGQMNVVSAPGQGSMIQVIVPRVNRQAES